jgi:transmembrane sensor
VWLERGEAYFQVKHNSENPFVVYAGHHRVTDLGTKFLVRRDPGRLEVALIEGSVRFGAAAGNAQSALLKPGDVATATTGTMFVAKESLKRLDNELSWRRGLLVFKHTTLAAAASEFNRYNRQQLIIADPAAASLTIDGTFPVNNVGDFAKLAEVVLGLKVEHHGGEIVIRSAS